MNLSSAIDYLTHDKEYLQRQLHPKYREAIDVIIHTIHEHLDVEEIDFDYEHEKPMCTNCNGNGCVWCNGTGEAKIY